MCVKEDRGQFFSVEGNYGDGDDDNNYHKVSVIYVALVYNDNDNDNDVVVVVSILKPDPCKVKYNKVGCFKDKKKSRTLPELILNERSSIDWDMWDTWLPGFICRCAEKTKEKKYFYFGAQYYGK